VRFSAGVASVEKTHGNNTMPRMKTQICLIPALLVLLISASALYAADPSSTNKSGALNPNKSSAAADAGIVDQGTASKPSQSPALPGQKEGPLDRSLTAKVRAALAGRDTGTSATGPSTASAIEVSSFHGVVTLRGKVNSQEEKQAILNKIQALGGVTIVKNELQVTQPAKVEQGAAASSETDHKSSNGPKKP
jgi:hypothetical protein